MNSKTKNIILLVLTAALVIAIVILVGSNNKTALELKLLKQTTSAELKAIEKERSQLQLEKMFLKHTADSLLEVANAVPKIIFKNKIIYVEKIDSVLHTSSDKRVQLFTDRTRKGFRHK
jgi:hypothetical protein